MEVKGMGGINADEKHKIKTYLKERKTLKEY